MRRLLDWARVAFDDPFGSWVAWRRVSRRRLALTALWWGACLALGVVIGVVLAGVAR